MQTTKTTAPIHIQTRTILTHWENSLKTLVYSTIINTDTMYVDDCSHIMA